MDIPELNPVELLNYLLEVIDGDLQTFSWTLNYLYNKGHPSVTNRVLMDILYVTFRERVCESKEIEVTNIFLSYPRLFVPDPVRKQYSFHG